MALKLSQFNNFITLSAEKILGYNTFSRRFIILPAKIMPVITSFGDSENTRDLEEAIVHDLSLTGFLVDSHIDEVEILDQEIQQLDFDKTHYELSINPTLDCNFRCWYCYENHHQGSEMSEKTLSCIKKHLDDKLVSPIESFALSFFGGEPLLKFDKICKPLIEYAYSLCFRRGIAMTIHFTSNASLVTPGIADFLAKYQCSFQITLDGYRTFHDKVRFPKDGNGSYDLIMDNIQLLSNKGIAITLRINFTWGNIQSIRDIINDLSKRHLKYPENILVNFQRVWQDHHIGHREEIIALLSDYKKALTSLHISNCVPDLMNPRFESCYGDKENFACINYNGDFFKCTARDFNRANRCGKINSKGIIVWEDGKEDVWRNSKFQRQICRECRIAPICLSGCRQKNIESPDNGECPLGYGEDRKNDLILQRFEAQYLQTTNSNQ